MIGGVAIAAAILIGFIVGDDRGWIAGCAAGAVAALIRISWPLRQQPWFWAATGSLCAINALAIVYFDWSFTHSWTGHSVSALMLIDTVVMMAIIYGLYCVFYGVPSQAVAQDEPYSKRDLDL